VVLSDSPTLTGTITTAAINAISITASKNFGSNRSDFTYNISSNWISPLNSAAINTSLDVAGLLTK
jgi:hypothetical protein